MAANEPVSGDMGGISGADSKCYNQARRAGLSGTFRALLSSWVQDLDSIVHKVDDRNVPIVNAKVGLLEGHSHPMFSERFCVSWYISSTLCTWIVVNGQELMTKQFNNMKSYELPLLATALQSPP